MFLLMTLACSDSVGLRPVPDQRPGLDDSVGDTAVADTGTPPPDCDAYAHPSGDLDASGLRDAPWPSLEVLAEARAIPRAGVLCLLPGHHGAPVLSALDAEGLRIQSTEPLGAELSSLAFVGVHGVQVDGVLVRGTDIDPARDERDAWLVSADAQSSHLTLSSLRVESAASSAAWTVADWTLRSKSGVDLRGPHMQVLDTELRNTHHALSLRGDHALVQGCLVDNFGGDGIRGLGSHSTYAWNTVRDAYVDAYETQHDDAFQAYELEGDLKIEDVWIHHNRFLLFADPITDFVREEQLIGTLMQGILISDGYADGWVVENNLVVNANYHGISLYGGRNCRIQNNTVVRHPAFPVEDGPWIRITDQSKTGQENADNIIRNNLAALLTPWDYDASSEVSANLQIDGASELFMDPQSLDFSLSAGSAALDAGEAHELQELDLSGQPRLAGAGVDLGAFERQP